VAEGDPTCQNVMDQGGDGDMKLGMMIATGIIGMHSCGLVQYPYDFPFRQKVSAVQRAHRRFTDCEGGGSGNVRDIWHWVNLLRA